MNLKIFHPQSLKTRVALFTLSMLALCIIAMALFSSWALRIDMQRLLGEQQFSTVSMVAAEVNRGLEERVKALELVAQSIGPELLANPAALQKFLDQQVVLHSLFNSGEFVLSPIGTAIADYPISTGRIGVSHVDQKDMAMVLGSRKSVIGTPRLGGVLKAPVFAIAAPVLDANGTLLGVLAGVTSLEKPNFLDNITNSSYGKTGTFFLVAPKERLIVTASDKSRVMDTLPAPGVVPEIDRMLAGAEGSAVSVNEFGVEGLASAKGVPVAGWVVSASVPTADAFAPLRTMIARRLTATFFLALAVGALTWWMLRRALAPISTTLQSLAGISESTKPIQPLPVARHDEVGQLIAGFNKLIDTVNQRDEALRQRELYQRALLDNFPYRVWLKDEQSRFLAVNKAFANGFAWPSPESLIGKTDLDIAPPDLAAGYRADDEAVLASGVSKHVEELIESEGQRQWFETYKSPVVIDGKVIGTVGFARDMTAQKHAEQVLLESEAQLTGILEATADGILAVSLDGKVLRTNARFGRMWGIPPETLKCGDDADLLRFVLEQLDDPDAFLKKVQALYHSATVDIDVLSFKNGRHFERVSTPLILNGAMFGRVWAFRDITERMLAETALRESEARFRSLVELGSDWYWEQDADLRFTQISIGILHHASLSPEEYIGKKRWEIEYVGMNDELWRRHREQLERHEPFLNFRMKRRASDGTVRTIASSGEPVFDVSGRFTGYRGVGSDITAQRQAEDKVRASERKLSEILESVDAHIYLKDKEGRYLFANRPVRELFGASMEEIVGRSDEDFFDAETAIQLRMNDREVLEDGKTLRTEETNLNLKDGMTSTYLSVKLPLRNESGDIYALCGISTDITERKRLEMSMQKINAELEFIVAERTRHLVEANAELQTITYTLAHDLRAPARQVAGFAAQFAEEFDPQIQERTRRRLTLMIASANRQAQLVEDMLAYMQLGFKPVVRELVDIRALVGELVAATSEADARGAQVEWQPGDLPAVEGDPSLIRVILSNLINNAVKYSGPAGQPVIEIGSVFNEEDPTAYFVRDNGVGFNAARATKLFGLFQRFHDPGDFPGTGIGLAIVKRLVEKHGGRVWAESTPGAGATFYFTLQAEALNDELNPA